MWIVCKFDVGSEGVRYKVNVRLFAEPAVGVIVEAAAPTRVGGDLKFHSTCFLSWSFHVPLSLFHICNFQTGLFTRPRA